MSPCRTIDVYVSAVNVCQNHLPKLTRSCQRLIRHRFKGFRLAINWPHYLCTLCSVCTRRCTCLPIAHAMQTKHINGFPQMEIIFWRCIFDSSLLRKVLSFVFQIIFWLYLRKIPDLVLLSVRCRQFGPSRHAEDLLCTHIFHGCAFILNRCCVRPR